MGLCVFCWPISLVMIERIHILSLIIIIIESGVWTITHCLRLGHETMVCAVCLSVFLWTPASIFHFLSAMHIGFIVSWIQNISIHGTFQSKYEWDICNYGFAILVIFACAFLQLSYIWICSYRFPVFQLMMMMIAGKVTLRYHCVYKTTFTNIIAIDIDNFVILFNIEQMHN